MNYFRISVLLVLVIFQLSIAVSSVATPDTTELIAEDEVILEVDFTDYFLSVKTYNAKMSDLLKEIATQTGVRIVVDSPIEDRVSINFERKGFSRGMRFILSSLKNGNYEGDFHLGKTFADSIYKIREISKDEIGARRDMLQQKAVFFYIKGDELLKEGKDYQAYQKFIASLRADSEYLPSHKKLVSIFQLWQDDEKLIARIEKVINLEPDNAYNYLWLADACRREYLYGKATENYSKFLDKSPNNENAERIKEIIVQMNSKESLEYLALISESKDFIRDKQIEQAKKILNQAIRLDSSKEKAYELMALVYELQHNYQDAVKWRTRFAEISPNNIKNLLFMSRDLRFLSDLQAALKYLQKAKQLSMTEYMTELIEKEQELMK